ncbi:hypothetical protein O9929_01055 [Vibrio lentus]|nr:hypothetical protein [Vibrio lentus]
MRTGLTSVLKSVTPMEAGCGIYRQEDLMQETINKITELKARYKEDQH